MKIDCKSETYLMTMQRMLWFLLFAAQIFHSCGKVILLRGSSHYPYSFNIHHLVIERKYICLSEDDGGALVWNDDIKQYQQGTLTPKSFVEPQSIHKNNTWIKCKILGFENIEYTDPNCLESWFRRNWFLTTSIKTPMGPVFDQRWEELYNNENSFTAGLLQAGAMSISIRSCQDTQIFICLTDNSREWSNADKSREWSTAENVWKNCFRILLKYKTKSSIDFCKFVSIQKFPHPDIRDFKVFNHNCSSSIVTCEKCLSLSATEWRTFVISWDFWKRNISVYGTNNEMLTFEAEQFDLTSEEKVVLFSFPTSNYYKRRTVLYRFHYYSFLHTIDKTAVLTTRYYIPNTQKICIQLLLGLCAECDADVAMIDSKRLKILQSVTATGSLNAAIHGLPMWQLVKFDGYFSIDTIGAVKIRVIPKLTKLTHNPLWAIGDLRECPNKEVLRKVSGIQEHYDFILLPNVTCQKLFFNENTVVSSLSTATNSMDLDDKICLEGHIGPECSFSCKHDLNSTFNCRGTAICYNTGCLCSPGFQGNVCTNICDENSYGHNCIKKCGFCKPTDTLKCDKVTGECISGCNDTSELKYVPPLCHIGIKKLTVPEIVSVTSTSIRTKLPIVWKEKYEQITIKYFFTLMGENNYTSSQSWNRLFQNMTHLIGYFTHLNPGSVYSVKCTLLAENVIIESNWQTVKTDCEHSMANELWLLPILLFIIIATVIFYIYRRRRRQVVRQIMVQNEMEMWQNTEKTSVKLFST
ncbi:uncharacterized protein LOC109858053 [Pseudomyrmex gracilis]|uniref:uncharacterized protein LOC109858053 n=1 Tax=Pseudomyrmex gracilis TaxID=219809 RepID=UPI000995990F|nr:uncharacterized protein LOC109858053 [Pseudomyrmex gracilis]